MFMHSLKKKKIKEIAGEDTERGIVLKYIKRKGWGEENTAFCAAVARKFSSWM